MSWTTHNIGDKKIVQSSPVLMTQSLNLHVFATSDMNTIGVRARIVCRNGYMCQLDVVAVLHRDMDLLDVYDFQVLRCEIVT